MPTLPSLGRRSRRAALALLLAAAGCIDGPFVRANPSDVDPNLQLSIVGGADTARVVGTRLEFRLASKPAISGYPVEWSSSAPANLYSFGEGVFVVNFINPTPLAVTVAAVVGRVGPIDAPRSEGVRVERVIHLVP